MSEVEKQEGQKTVVSFITGLLIGGLLVWVFSSSPETKVEPKEESAEANTEQTADATEKTDEEKTEKIVASNTKTLTQEAVGEGLLKVADQTAGETVTLERVELPTTNGWVVVRDFKDEVGMNVLGAARYGVDEGLMPVEVPLLRATEVGNTYQVVFFTNEGGMDFSLADDKLIEGISTTFKAN